MDSNSIKNILVGVAKSAAHMATGGVSDQFFDALLGPDSTLTPEAKAELQKAKIEQATTFKQLEAQGVEAQAKAATDAIIAVNQTMQAESKSDSWLQKSWRPLCGLTLCAVVVMNYVIIPIFGGYHNIKPVEVPPLVWTSFLAICGVTAYTRGQEKTARVSADAGNDSGS